MQSADTFSKRPHILWALNSMEIGGTETFSLEVVPRLMKHARVTVLLAKRRGELFDELKRRGAEIVETNLPGKFHRGRIEEASRLIRAISPDIVHTHSQNTAYLIRIAAILAGVPSIVTHLHGMVEVPAKDSDMMRRERHILPCTDRVLFVSDAIRDKFRQSVRNGSPLRKDFESRLQVVHDGIDLDAFRDPGTDQTDHLRLVYGIPKDTPVIGTVGRLHPIKNLESIIEVVASLRSRWPDLRCLFVGEGMEAYKAELRNQAQSLGVEGNLIFAGYHNNVTSHLGLMDVFLLASHSEGLPRSVMEALAAGVPVVASNLPGLEEILAEGSGGTLVPQEDAGALADRVQCLLDNPDLRTLMSQNARKRAAGFDLDGYIERLLNIYREALECPAREVRRSRLLFRAGYAALKKI